VTFTGICIRHNASYLLLYCTEDGFQKAGTYVPCSKTTVTLNKELRVSYSEQHQADLDGVRPNK